MILLNKAQENTTFGKTFKTVLWLAFANAAPAIIAFVVGNPELFNPTTIALANVIGVLVKNLVADDVKNY